MTGEGKRFGLCGGKRVPCRSCDSDIVLISPTSELVLTDQSRSVVSKDEASLRARPMTHVPGDRKPLAAQGGPARLQDLSGDSGQEVGEQRLLVQEGEGVRCLLQNAGDGYCRKRALKADDGDGPDGSGTREPRPCTLILVGTSLTSCGLPGSCAGS